MSGLACGTCGHGICTCEPELGVQLWWHAYGGVVEDFGGCWQLAVYGPGTASPKTASELDGPSGTRYLASWDHAPSDAEKDEITPEDYRADGGDDW